MTAVADKLASALQLLRNAADLRKAGARGSYGEVLKAIKACEEALAEHDQAARCGTCKDEIKPDVLTGTTCKCAPATADPMAAAMYGHDLHPEGYAPPTVQPAPAAQAVDLDELRRAVCVVSVVGQINGHDVVRRNSVLDVIDVRRRRLIDSQSEVKP